MTTRSGHVPPAEAPSQLPPREERIQPPDLDPVPSQAPGDIPATGGVDLLWDGVSAPRDGGEAVAGATRHYQCAECGHLNPAENRFCGMCGAAHGHHILYGSSPYLLVAIALLLVVISWRSGWDYGLRVGAPTGAVPAAATAHPATLPQAAETKSSPAAMPAGERKPESPAAPANPPDSAAASFPPYRNELQGFNFYAKYLAPLHPGISQSAAVVRVLGDGGKLPGWKMVATYGARPSHGSALGPLAEIIVNPEGVIPMAAVRFPATFTHCRAVGGERNALFDVYRDGSGLEYWLYATDSNWGNKGDLYRIVYGPSGVSPGHKPTC